MISMKASFLSLKHSCAAGLLIALTACEPKVNHDASSDAEPVATSSGDLIGCYTVSHEEPAQIKINQVEGGFNMQMRELEGSPNVWDKPAPLAVIDVDKGWDYFKVNTLDLNKNDVDAMIGRSDGMMVLAKVKDTAININPRLDSSYVMYIVQGSNTVYKVACD
ncbi:Uncharacterised protein [Moraxella ovis]|nr:Uncharacterised protein [Moraxella ovis]STZ05175.1 Uncharacterised protein [Moraxella ovis]